MKKYKKKQYKCTKLKIIAPTKNDEFELPNDSYSVSDIQDYVEFIIKKTKNIIKHFPYSCLHQ